MGRIRHKLEPCLARNTANHNLRKYLPQQDVYGRLKGELSMTRGPLPPFTCHSLYVLQVRLCCSLRWLSSVLPSSLLREEVASEGIRDTPLTVKQLLLSPFQRSTLKKEVVNLLTSPHLYICAHGAIVPNEQLDSDSTFWPLIQGLSKRGIYVVDEDETVVNHTVLTQRDPFKQVSRTNCSYINSLVPRPSS